MQARYLRSQHRPLLGRETTGAARYQHYVLSKNAMLGAHLIIYKPCKAAAQDHEIIRASMDAAIPRQYCNCIPLPKQVFRTHSCVHPSLGCEDRSINLRANLCEAVDPWRDAIVAKACNKVIRKIAAISMEEMVIIAWVFLDHRRDYVCNFVTGEVCGLKDNSFPEVMLPVSAWQRARDTRLC